MTERINLKDAKNRVLGWLIPHPTGNGYIGEFKYDGLEPISYYGARKQDALKWFTRAMEDAGHKMAQPSNMYDWVVIRQTTGWFSALPSALDDIDDVMVRNIPAYEAWEICKRAEKVQQIIGAKMLEVRDLDHLWQIEARLKELGSIHGKARPLFDACP